MKKITYGIPEWSHVQYKAKYNYRCEFCEGVIPAGTQYLRHVVRLGPRKGKDPLRNVHVHLNCEAPWWQPGPPPHCLKYVGKLPGRTPSAAVQGGARYYHKPSIAITTPAVGTFQWQPSKELLAKLMFMKNQHLGASAMAEIEQALLAVMTALTQAVGHQRKAMKLNHVLHDIKALIDYTPAPNDPPF